MNKPDRVERMVHEEALYLSGNMAKRLPLADVVTLLRRMQQQERRRVKRIVQKLPRYGFDELISPTDLLAALRKGTR